MPHSGGIGDGFEPPKYLVSLIASISDGAKAAQAGMLAFLAVGLYLLATAFSASDEDILLGKAVTISQIGASLPVSFSFAMAPLVFVFLHIYALTRYDMLAANVRFFVGELAGSVLLETDRERCRQLLPNVEFVLAQVAPRGSARRSLIWPVLFFCMLGLFPLLVLLTVQIDSLRAQDELIGWAQRLWLLIDVLALMTFFCRNQLNGGALGIRSRVGAAALWAALITLPVVMIGTNLAWLGIVQPDADARLVRYSATETKATWKDRVRQPLDLIFCPHLNWGCRYLRVEHRTLVDHVWDEKAMAELRTDGRDYATATAGIEGIVLRNRNLRFAVLDDSRLYAADLVGADLRNASLRGARLPLARLSGPGTRMQGAVLRGANLENAGLDGAALAGADLSFAELENANMRGAQMPRADLANAQLSGAQMSGAQLIGADLADAQLIGTDLSGAQLVAAELSGAQLAGAVLRKSELAGAEITGADLTATDLREANAWNVTSLETPDKATVLRLADLREMSFKIPPPENTRATWSAIFAAVRPPISEPGLLQQLARERLDSALASSSTAAALEFVIPSGGPALVSDSRLLDVASSNADAVVVAPSGNDGWRSGRPATYLKAISDFLVGDLARAGHLEANSIAWRMGFALASDPTDPPPRLVACDLLAAANTKTIVLEPGTASMLTDQLRTARVNCANPVPSTTVTKLEPK